MIIDRLFSCQDIKYRDFMSSLIPNIDKETVIGVRMPEIKTIAKEIKNTKEAEMFLSTLPHSYYEENILHACLLTMIKDYNECVSKIDEFIPYIDNWAVCDIIHPKCFAKHTQELYPMVMKWLSDKRTYSKRYAVGTLMTYYLDEKFDEDHLEIVSEIRSDEYYINMMTAWYFATALAKQYESTIPYIVNHRLDNWTHRKAIQKAIESRRISDETKEYLRTLR